MSRISGRNGSMYAGISSAGTAEPIAFLNHWTINFNVATIDVTAFGDTNLVKVAGLPDASGTYAGFFDNATAQMYTAATDGVARKFYLYPDRTVSTTYWFGTAVFDASYDGSVAGAVTTQGNFAAASAVPKVG